MALPGREIKVTSWVNLVKALNSRDVVQPRPGEGNHLRSPYVFRGMDSASWDLATSFQRLSKTTRTNSGVVEHSMLRTFRKYANAGAFDRQSEWYVLAVAQHNGLPTRCLDWTTSPLVAAHFACGDEQYKNADGAIWCVHAGLLREINQTNNPSVADLRGIAWVYDTRLLESSFAGLRELDASLTDGELLLLWEPPSLDQRIANQGGLLSIMNSSAGSQDGFLARHASAYPDVVLRIIISARMKAEARDMLDQSNISERALFPGLPGLCSWLKRYYGASW